MPPGSPDVRPGLSQWAGPEPGADIEALEALETYRKKDPSKGVRGSSHCTNFLFGRIELFMLWQWWYVSRRLGMRRS